jgi:F0F1-type ATP synthase alpha subunit
VKLADFLGTRKTELLNQIAREKALTDEMTTALKAAVTEFKSTWR